MARVVSARVRSQIAALWMVAAAAFVFHPAAAAQGVRPGGDDTSITYTRGQSVVPVYHGWMGNADGSFDLYFTYINRNWQEEVDIPIGPENTLSPVPYGPDGGQPTHFLPRVNRWVFSVHVPKNFGKQEIVWTLTSHGQTHRAYASLNAGYEIDEFLIQHEFGNSSRGRKPPTLQVEGEKQRTVKAGQSVPLVAVATDPNPPLPRRLAAQGQVEVQDADRARARERLRSNAELPPGSLGGDFIRGTARGLYLGWLVYRGAGDKVRFDPPIPFKMWEDQRGGSPWSPGWQPPPVPAGNKWIYNVVFQEPGTYVLRAQVRDGFLFANEHVTFTVTR
jgi:hypothetical protein